MIRRGLADKRGIAGQARRPAHAPATTYRVRAVVSNSCGSATSDPATYSVCYADCECTRTNPRLNINDFICFQQRFAAGEHYANCDGSTVPPVLNIGDFICFQQHFAAGCP